MTRPAAAESTCTIQRTNDVIGDRWTTLILREAFFGNRRFGTLRSRLGIAPDILSARLAALVERGLLVKELYREEGTRAREEYVLTEAGREMLVILGAMSEWSTRHNPPPTKASAVYREASTGGPVHVAFVTEDGRILGPDDVELSPV
ncbi:helix-turn-helix domain-containing protein [Leifsonia sp. NPDC077715]|uniref:winged helix-turn-helix transcriptional regulator n=1 Tax=Leifsonia sp. NPDC077715 TaxID=3155539 RepID=UPI003430CD54